MKKLALIADIHGNHLALRAVLDDIRARGVDAVYCLGDLVGYAPFPNEVIEIIRREGIPTVMGNYDDGVGFERMVYGCDFPDEEARQAGDRSGPAQDGAEQQDHRHAGGHRGDDVPGPEGHAD